MLLLHGPSGCGKTVLASVAARQAGYNPFIINLKYGFCTDVFYSPTRASGEKAGGLGKPET